VDPTRSCCGVRLRRWEFVLNAEPADQLRLLDLQALDSRLDQLTHRARTLPEHEQLSQLQRRRADVDTLLIAARTEVSDIERQQAKADDDVEQVRARSARDQERLNSGAVTSAKDLEALQHEIATLARRQADLEEVELEVMERLEDAQRNLASLAAEAGELDASIAATTAQRDASIAGIQDEARTVGTERAGVVPTIPGDLLALYTKLRDSNGGIGAARLHRRRCEGCRMELNATELVRIKGAAADEVLRCEECRRILVRTEESGL
jgi:predicted  nucleic acid-binding Zn-ribbon protein